MIKNNNINNNTIIDDSIIIDTTNDNTNDTIIDTTNDTTNDTIIDTTNTFKEKILKKRGRKVKNKLIDQTIDNNKEFLLTEQNINLDIIDSELINNNEELIQNIIKPIAKKRGRKPKGGKIIQQVVSVNNNKEVKSNIILHLKCFLKDLQDSKIFTSNIETFNFSNSNKLSYEILNETSKTNEYINIKQIIKQNIEENIEENDYYESDCEDNNTKDANMKNIWKKLKILQHNFHVNNTYDKKSCCFWCTYDFDNPPIYIPKYYVKNSYNVYGCFCTPECAVAHLMEENIDTSSKFERYYLINHIYSKIYDYKKNIKPAPNPYYMLEKFYGNLSIQEYRSLLKNERLFLVVDKPLTRILPELHEDNDDFIINNKIIPSNNYKIKKKIQNKQTKNNILNEQFGLT